jgi:hypothetical protein
VFALNDLTTDNVTMLPLGNDAALRALQSDEVDAAVFVDGAQNRAVWAALHDPHMRLMSYGHADAYPRLLPYINKLTLPSGVIDVARDIPEKEIALVGTKAMLAARADRTVGGCRTRDSRRTGSFRGGGRVPGNDRVDLRISNDADRHKRFGPSFLYRYLPFWLATFSSPPWELPP